jgi:RND family efflux transporter MFP subunit
MTTYSKKYAPHMEPKRSRSRALFIVILSLVILTVGVATSAYIIKTAPKAKKRQPVKTAALVKTVSVKPDKQHVVVPAMGTVVPAREIVLESQVSGEIVSVNPGFVVGGLLKKGAEILRIDDQDYQLALTLAQSKVKDAESNLEMLEAEAAAAKEEWRKLYGDHEEKGANPPPLVFKKPQLEAARASLMAGKAEVKKARLNLGRTRITAPFNAMVRTKHVDTGSQISAQEKLAELVGTDEYWIQASIPIDNLSWITIPRSPGDKGSKVHVSYRNRHVREGRVIKLLGDLETEGRMARILVEVKNPLKSNTGEDNQAPLLIGEYLHVDIEGRELENVYRIPRHALRDDSSLWIASNEDKLEIRQIKTLWRDTETVILREGLNQGDRLIVSDLAAPIEGMDLKVVQ